MKKRGRYFHPVLPPKEVEPIPFSRHIPSFQFQLARHINSGATMGSGEDSKHDGCEPKEGGHM
eukprot:3539304-Pyramimonas_sp.AAC.1